MNLPECNCCIFWQKADKKNLWIYLNVTAAFPCKKRTSSFLFVVVIVTIFLLILSSASSSTTSSPCLPDCFSLSNVCVFFGQWQLLTTGVRIVGGFTDFSGCWVHILCVQVSSKAGHNTIQQIFIISSDKFVYRNHEWALVLFTLVYCTEFLFG